MSRTGRPARRERVWLSRSGVTMWSGSMAGLATETDTPHSGVLSKLRTLALGTTN